MSTWGRISVKKCVLRVCRGGLLLAGSQCAFAYLFLTPIRNYSAREILPYEHQASPKSCFYLVPQNALYVRPVPRLQLSWNGVSTG